MYDNFDDFNEVDIDSEIMAIINENSETSFTPMYENERNPQRPVNSIRPQTTNRTNEIAVATSSLDSQGHILNVGDKVTIGNDKAIGRIVALGKNAKVRIKDEGDYDFPCSVLTLYKDETPQGFVSETKNAYNTLMPQERVTEHRTPRKNDDRVISYNIESLIRSHGEEDYNDVSNYDPVEGANRLQEMGGDGQPFDMGIE